MDSCDVLIAGGGPAGSSCAWALRSSGLHVTILDKASFPRNKPCGGWITPTVFEALAIDPDDYARGRTLQPITGFLVGCMARHAIEVDYARTVSYGIRRYEFDEFLLRRSQADVRERLPIISIQHSGDSWIVNGNIKTRCLVGAGGHFCPVGRSIGNASGGPPVVAQEVEFEMDEQQAASCSVRQEIPELYFCQDLRGYGWCFRKGDFINVGLGRLDQHGLGEHVTRFVQFLRATGRLLFDLPHRLCGHAYLLSSYSRRELLDDGVLLIGDAAGLAHPQSGEGILPAVESGLLAARVIRSANGNYARCQLQAYPALLAGGLISRRSLVETAAERLPCRLRNAVGRWLLSKEWFCRREVIENWFLHASSSELMELSSEFHDFRRPRDPFIS